MRIPAAALCAAALLLGCGKKEDVAGSPDPASEKADRAAAPRPGWRATTNRAAGFTISLPKHWTARTRQGATLLRSDDRLLALTVTADRSKPGREIPARDYARMTLESLPGAPPGVARPKPVRGSPYEAARVDATGRQRITVASFRRPGRVTYTVVAFRNAKVQPKLHDRALDTILKSLRARPPKL